MEIEGFSSGEEVSLFEEISLTDAEIKTRLEQKNYSLFVTNAGNTVLHQAARKGDIEALELALAYGFPIHQPNRKGDTPLHIAAAKGQTQAAQFLLDAGADPLATNNLGQTPYHLALKNHAQETQALLAPDASDPLEDLLIAHDFGPEIDADSIEKAIQLNDLEALKLLFTFFGDDDFLCGNHVLLAVKKGNQAILSFLLEHDAYYLNASDKKGNSLLHLTLQTRNTALALFLLEQEGLHFERRNNIGIAPIHYAVFYGDAAVVEKLLARGADVNLRTQPPYIDETAHWTYRDWDAWAEVGDPYGGLALGGYEYPVVTPLAITSDPKMIHLLEENGGELYYSPSYDGISITTYMQSKKGG